MFPRSESKDNFLAFTLTRREDGRLDLLDARGQTHHGVEVVQAFPLTDPTGPLAILSADGSELVWLTSVRETDALQQTILNAELKISSFVPEILRIESIGEGDPAEWVVLTDRGLHRMKVPERDSIVRTRSHGVKITDTDSIDFRIKNLESLDRTSRRLLDKKL